MTESQPGNSRIKNACGTRAAAERHRRHGEPICDPCRDAERTYYRERARLIYTIPTLRVRENERTRERMRRYREDPAWRERRNAARRRAAQHRRAQDQWDRRHTIDPIVVERLVNGVRAQANRLERLEAVRQLRLAGFGHNAIAERVHVDPRHVARDLRTLGLTRHNTDALEVSA